MLNEFNASKLMFRRRLLRKKQTQTEKVLWRCLRNHSLGCKIRRQCGIGPYIVDFCCVEKKLIIEIDGPYHENTTDEDIERTNHLESLGYEVTRFTNEEIETNLPSVVERIRQYLHNPSPFRRGSARAVARRG